MKMKLKKYVMLLLTLCVFQLGTATWVMAAEGSITYGSSSYSATQGDTFQVGVYVKGSEAIGAYEFYLNYDSDMLEYVSGADSGGAGRLKFVGYGNTSSYSYMLNFRAKTAGSTTISISDAGIYPLDPNSGDTMTITAVASAPVSVKGPDTSSSENRLATLTVSPTGLYGFDPDKTEYDITVDNSITKLSISATTKDAKATFTISDTNLEVGVNTITISVTAENGNVKDYKIIVRRKAEAETTSAKETTTAKEQTTGETKETQTTEAPTETTTAAKPPEELEEPELGISFGVNGKEMFVQADLSSLSSPAGFEKSSVTYKGQDVPAFISTDKGITLFYLKDGLGSNGGFYVYDAENNNVYPYISLTNSSMTYMLLTADDSVESPNGYTRTTVALSTGSSENVQTNVTAWISSQDSDFFLVYALNDDGEKGFYQYDKKEGTLQRYHAEKAAGEEPSANPESGEGETTAPPPSDGEEPPTTGTSGEKGKTPSNSDKSKQMKQLLIIGIVVCVGIVVLVVTIVIIRMRKREDKNPYDDLEFESEDELIRDIESIRQKKGKRRDSLEDLNEEQNDAAWQSAAAKEESRERTWKRQKEEEEVLNLDDDDFEFLDDDDQR